MQQARYSSLGRLLLRLYPEEFRRAHGDELLAFIEEDLSRKGGGIRFWTFTSLDVLRSAFRLRWRERKRVIRGRRSGCRRVPSFPLDFRQALRSIRATPLTSALIVSTLALGIALDTTIFSVVDAVLFEPLPYEHPDRLFYVDSRWTAEGVEHAHHTGADFKFLKRTTNAFADVAAVVSIRQNLTGIDPPLQVQVGWASRNLFRLLGVAPALGPGFTEDAPAGTLVLGYRIWQEVFGGTDDVVGKVVRLDDHPYTIAGVLPRGFALQLPRFPSDIDLWKVPDDWWQNGDVWTHEGADFAILDVVAKLATNATPAQAREELKTLARERREDRTEYARAGLEYVAVPLRDSLVGEVRSQLWLLLGAVALVLLAACANVTSLMLARARARAGELGLRLVLGASRGRIARLLLTEASLYAMAGGSTGVALTFAATRWVTRMGPDSLPRLHEISIHHTVLAFALALTLGLTFFIGLVPALTTARGDVPRLLSGSRATEVRESVRLGKILVVTQLAASLVLWMGAALLTRSLLHLTEVNPGFDPDHVLTFSVSLPGTKYERPEGTDRFFRKLESRIEALPGVGSAGVVWPLPLSGRNWSNTYVAGGVKSTERAYAEYRLATPGYFGTMAIGFLEGRNFSRGDRRHVAIVNHALAQRAFGGRSALGREVRANPWGADLESFEIIGVVADVRYQNLRRPARETIYFDSRGWSWTDWEVDFVVRTLTDGSPEAVVGPIRKELASLDPSIPLSRPRAMTAYLSDHLAANRFALTLIGLFAGVAGVLALVGLYGVVSHSVQERRHEIGIRMALGCNRRGILIWIYRGGMTLIALGISLGAAGALLLGRFLDALLVGVASTDGLTLAAAASSLMIVGSLACLVPARRAARVDPMSVLRSE